MQIFIPHPNFYLCLNYVKSHESNIGLFYTLFMSELMERLHQKLLFGNRNNWKFTILLERTIAVKMQFLLQHFLQYFNEGFYKKF